MHPTHIARYVLGASAALALLSGCQSTSHPPERVWPAETPGSYPGRTPATQAGEWWFPSEIGPREVPATGGNKGTVFYLGHPDAPRPDVDLTAARRPPAPGIIRRVVYKRVFEDQDVRAERLIFPGVTFAEGSVALDAESQAQLRQAAAAMARAQGYNVVIEGHRETGEAEGLDAERADVVRGTLTALGVSAARLTTQALGDGQPLSRDGSPAGRALNRRVAFEMLPASLDLEPSPGPPDDPIPEVPRGMRLETIEATITIPRPRLVFVDRLVFPNILFDYDKAHLRPEGVLRADRAGAAVRALDNVRKLTVVGHCDIIGSHQYNDPLSLRRAGTVRDRLVEAGVPADLLAVDGRGKRQPIADNTTQAGRQLNRRVEFYIEYAE